MPGSDRSAAAKRKWQAMQWDMREAGEQLSLIRARRVLAIADEVDANGKSRYRNQQTREAALTVALAEDTEYQDILARLRVMRLEAEQLADELREAGREGYF